VRILLSAFACEPGRGSEQEVGWRWALELSVDFDVTVLTQDRNRPGIERALAAGAGEGRRLRFEYLQLPRPLPRWKSRWDFLTLPYYAVWQWPAMRRVRELHREQPFDVIHHLTFASFRVPIWMKRVGPPVVMGPVGGAEQAPWHLLAYRSQWQTWTREAFRNVMTRVSIGLLRFFPPLAGRGLCLAATPGMQRIFERQGLPCRLFPTIGADGVASTEPIASSNDRACRFLFVGRLHLLKGVQLLLPAFADSRLANTTLTIVGAGPEEVRLKPQAAELGLSERIDWRGAVPRAELDAIYRAHDILVAPSLYESGGLAVLEAMERGLPVIVLNVGGHGVSVTDECGIRLSPNSPVPDVIAALSDAMARYAHDVPLRIAHGRAALARVKDEYDWTAKVRRMKAVYDEVLSPQPDRSREEAGKFLEQRCRPGSGVALLRYGVAGIERSAVSDWDLGVANETEEGLALEQEFGRPLVKVRRRFVVQRYFPWGQVDLLPRFEYHGAPYLKAERFRAKLRTGDDGIQRPGLAHDAWIVWMTGVLWGARFNPKYADLLVQAHREDGVELRRCAGEAFGQAWGEQLMAWLRAGRPELAAARARELRTALFRKHLSAAPVRLARSWLAHWLTELRNHLRPPFPWIAILGPDGSGKSSVIAGLTERLATIRIGIEMVHWRPHAFSRKPADATAAPVTVTDPHGKPPRDPLTSLLKLGLIGLDWWVGAWIGARHFRATRGVWMSDRYYDDLLIDPRRYRYGGPMWAARAAFRLLPRPDFVIVLTGDPEVIHARKQEVTLDELRRQTTAYRQLVNRLGPRAVAIDAGAPLDQVIESAWNAVVASQTARPLRRE
jgi:glycosyltransferase involved in cell wall biosynthesis/thymidylate kinase